MKNLAGLPERWAVDIEAEAEHPSVWKYMERIEQPTQLVLEDAKKAYVKALGLECKKIDWV